MRKDDTGVIDKAGWDKVTEKLERDKEILRKAHDSEEMRAFRFRDSLLKKAIQ